MTYNKNSFLAGLAVGRRLKGWSGGKGNETAPGGGSGIIFNSNPVYRHTAKVHAITAIVVGEYTEEA